MPPRILKGLASLTSLMTRLPVGGGCLRDAGEFSYLSPLIGLIVGAFSWFPSIYSSMASSSPAVGGAAYVASYLLITGCIHIDGFADFIDAALSGARGFDALRIMKDSRRGSFAAAWVSTLLIASYALSVAINSRLGTSSLNPLECLKYSLILSLINAWGVEGVFTAACIGRSEPYDGMGRYFTEFAGKPLSIALNLLVVGSLITAYSLILGVNPYALTASLASSAVAGLLTGSWGNRLLGFVNGDVLGAAAELGRVSSLTSFLVITCLGFLGG